MNDDAISRQGVLKLLYALPPEEATTKAMLIKSVKQMDAAQPYTDEEIQKMQDIEQAQLEKAYEIGKADALKWIPCSERLPEPGEYYLVTRRFFGWNCTEYREIDIAKYNFDGWHKANHVLAWCEMPEPWEGDEK